MRNRLTVRLRAHGDRMFPRDLPVRARLDHVLARIHGHRRAPRRASDRAAVSLDLRAGESEASGTWMTRCDSVGSSAAMWVWASSMRCGRSSFLAMPSASVNSVHAVAVRPSFSWHSATLRSVPPPGSSRWLSSSLRQPSATFLIDERAPFLKSCGREGLVGCCGLRERVCAWEDEKKAVPATACPAKPRISFRFSPWTCRPRPF